MPSNFALPAPQNTKRFVNLSVLIVLLQAGLGLWQVADAWTRGHVGFNGAAYHLAARNSLRWDLLFPLQYYTGTQPPAANMVYTHHPLAMHVHNVVSVWLLGDHEYAIRLVAALHGVLAAVMLLLFLKKFYSEAHALIATALYVLSPINAIFINMANHSSGFIAWILVFLYTYLIIDETKSRAQPVPMRWWALMFLSFLMAAQWDWPAYYVALITALFWAVGALKKRELLTKQNLVPLVGFCVWVLFLGVGHFVMVAWVTDNTQELAHTIRTRTSAVDPNFFLYHLRVVPALMFTFPVLALAALWLVFFAYRLVRCQVIQRDVAPVSFAAAGLLHYGIFRESAVIHEYWAWTLLPFIAIANADMVIIISQRIRRATTLAPMLAPWLVVLLYVPFVLRVVELVPAGRRVGGSMWFVAETRGPVVETYDSGWPELRFARQVRQWTDRNTGVLVHRSFERFRLEPRFDTTLDREKRSVNRLVLRAPRDKHLPNNWVFIAPRDALTPQQWRSAAARYPVNVWDQYAMIDMRVGANKPYAGVQTWKTVPQPSPWWWSWLVSSFEPPVRVIHHRAPDTIWLQ